MKRLEIISLGAGVQSSVMALMAAEGIIKPMPDAAIFADTGWEPESIYNHLEWLEDKLPFPVYKVSHGNLREDIIRSATDKTRLSNPPFFSKSKNGKKGTLWRSCTRDYKIHPIRRKLRELLGIKKITATTPLINLWIGISLDEINRMKPSQVKWILNKHPLIDIEFTRNDCLSWWESRYKDIKLEKSSCIGCPYHSDNTWRAMKNEDPKSWQDAVEIDQIIRGGIFVVTNSLYLHSSLKPLEDVDLETLEDKGQLNMFNEECEGHCGV